MKYIVLIFFMMLVTFGVRYPVLALLGRIELPKAIRRALNFVPVAVLSALCAPMVLLVEGQWSLSFSNDYLVASVLAIVVACISRQLLITIVAGMALFSVLRFF